MKIARTIIVVLLLFVLLLAWAQVSFEETPTKAIHPIATGTVQPFLKDVYMATVQPAPDVTTTKAPLSESGTQATCESCEGVIKVADDEYWECLSALYEAFYEVPHGWAEALAKYLDLVEPFDVTIEEPRILELVDLDLPESASPEVALYWVITWDRHGSMADSSVVESEDGPRLVWPVVDPERIGEEFADIISGMRPGEIWEFTAYEEYLGMHKYVVLATPDLCNIKALSMKFIETL